MTKKRNTTGVSSQCVKANRDLSER